MSTIIKDILHPENESGTDIYPKTSADQVVGYGQDLNGNDFALKEEVLKKPSGQSNRALFVVGTNATGDESVRVPVGNGNDEMPRRNNRGMVENSDLATYPNELIPKKQLDSAIRNVSLPVVNITATPTATQGTISASDLKVLQGNKSAIIRFNNELYYFMDDEYKSGYLTYSHVGVDASVQWVKSITITISSLSWVLTKEQVGGTKLYRHVVTFGYDDNPHTECSILIPRSTKFSSKEEFCNYFISKGYLPNLNSPACNIGVEMVKMGNTTSASVLRPIGVFCTDSTIVIYYLNVSNPSSITNGYLNVDIVLFQDPVEV